MVRWFSHIDKALILQRVCVSWPFHGLGWTKNRGESSCPGNWCHSKTAYQVLWFGLQISPKLQMLIAWFSVAGASCHKSVLNGGLASQVPSFFCFLATMICLAFLHHTFPLGGQCDEVRWPWTEPSKPVGRNVTFLFGHCWTQEFCYDGWRQTDVSAPKSQWYITQNICLII